ncbi:MAG TPA: AprI/Inh family metalloprotease inhibitor [Caulobacteraceae bacterium]|nr:AprI/Inh family metalloprotease inhibitor [Caulobacteraceae bacterium]
MSPPIRAAGLAAAVLLLAGGVAVAADEEAGVPLAPGEAAGAWTLETQGRAICVLKLGAEKTKAGAYRLDAPASCGDALPAGLAGWSPSDHGMNLVGADGRTLLGFGRWSNSLLVSHQTSGVDIQLRRGT